MPLTARKKVYITGSAYMLEVYSNLASGNSITAKVTVLGKLQSSGVRYTIKLFRGSKIISSYPRTGIAYSNNVTKSEIFTNVVNTGSINVEFELVKSGESGGTPGSTKALLYAR